jgi:hypothetical protein
MLVRTSSLGPPVPVTQQRDQNTPIHWLILAILLLSTIVVLGNFVIGAMTPTTFGFEDTLSLVDPMWRLVEGQHLGIDFHDPLGFGLFQVAADLWRLLGPQFDFMRGAIDVFALAIVWCGCVVAIRQLRYAIGLAALFCITVAFIASGPSTYGDTHNFGIAVTYNRLIISALSVLFVQSFAADRRRPVERGIVDYLIAAILLNILFLVKISGLIVGIAIVVIGMIVRDRFWRCTVGIVMVFIFLTIMIAMDFAVTGSDFISVILEYRAAAQGRVGALVFRDLLSSSTQLPLLAIVLLLAVYVDKEDHKRQITYHLFIIGLYWICQIVLNMSNNGGIEAIGFLAPAAAVVVVTLMESGSEMTWFWKWSQEGQRHKLRRTTIRQLIPLLIISSILMPELFASLRAINLDFNILSEYKIVTVTANRGVAFRILKGSQADKLWFSYLTRAIQAIEEVGVTRQTIANLDFMNPFPALFRAPSPKGVRVWWDFSNARNVPVGYEPRWQEVIGDACIVTEPKRSPLPAAYYSLPLINAVEAHLAIAFILIYQDDLWKIWARKSDCV